MCTSRIVITEIMGSRLMMMMVIMMMMVMMMMMLLMGVCFSFLLA